MAIDEQIRTNGPLHLSRSLRNATKTIFGQILANLCTRRTVPSHNGENDSRHVRRYCGKLFSHRCFHNLSELTCVQLGLVSFISQSSDNSRAEKVMSILERRSSENSQEKGI